MRKNQRKAIIKTLTWRVLSSSIFFGVAYLGIGSASVAGWMTLVDGVFKTLAYYLHELAWQGKMKKA